MLYIAWHWFRFLCRWHSSMRRYFALILNRDKNRISGTHMTFGGFLTYGLVIAVWNSSLYVIFVKQLNKSKGSVNLIFMQSKFDNEIVWSKQDKICSILICDMLLKYDPRARMGSNKYFGLNTKDCKKKS